MNELPVIPTSGRARWREMRARAIAPALCVLSLIAVICLWPRYPVEQRGGPGKFDGASQVTGAQSESVRGNWSAKQKHKNHRAAFAHDKASRVRPEKVYPTAAGILTNSTLEGGAF